MSLPTRRRFINSSLALAAASAAGSALAADLTGKAPAQPPANGPEPRKPNAATTKPNSLDGANDRINIAIIGAGDRGRYHISELLSMSDHVNVVALCDPDVARLERQSHHIEEETGAIPKVYQDVRKLLEDKEVDAVTVATCNHWHTLASIWAIQAGKDVFVEKPISHNVSEGRRLVEFARKHDKIVLHGTQSRSTKAMRQAMQFIHDGHLGKVFLARGLCYKKRPSIGRVEADQVVPETLDYDLWCGPAPKAPLHRQKIHYDWHWMWDTGNGDLGNQGVHQMDIAMWGLNKRALANRVQCVGGRLGYVDDGETPNTQLCVFDFDDDGAQIIFEVRGLESAPVPGAKKGVCNVFYGTEGSLVVNDYGSCTAYAPNGTEISMPAYDTGAPGNHFTTFLKALKSRKLGFHEGEAEAGHVGSAMCHLANISYRMGTKVPFNSSTQAFGDDRAAAASLLRLEGHLCSNGLRLEDTEYTLGAALQFDPKTEKFTNNEAANRMLTREYRAPYTVPDRVV